MRILYAVLGAAAFSASCGDTCGLGLHDLIGASFLSVPVGGEVFRDITVTGSGTQIDLSNKAGTAVGFVTATSCGKLFDFYPDSAPLCEVVIGPVMPGTVSGRVSVKAGSYRVFALRPPSATSAGPATLSVGIWDHRCMSPISGFRKPTVSARNTS